MAIIVVALAASYGRSSVKCLVANVCATSDGHSGSLRCGRVAACRAGFHALIRIPCAKPKELHARLSTRAKRSNSYLADDKHCDFADTPTLPQSSIDRRQDSDKRRRIGWPPHVLDLQRSRNVITCVCVAAMARSPFCETCFRARARSLPECHQLP